MDSNLSSSQYIKPSTTSIIIAIILLVGGIGSTVAFVLWRNGYLGSLPIEINTDQDSWNYYNNNLKPHKLLFPVEPGISWQDYLQGGQHKIDYLWIANDSGAVTKFGVEVKLAEPVAYRSLTVKLATKGTAYDSRSGSSCFSFTLAPHAIANIPMLLAVPNSQGLYVDSYVVSARSGNDVACNTSGVLSDSGQAVAQQTLGLSGGSLNQE
jgi:hypothetical protein